MWFLFELLVQEIPSEMQLWAEKNFEQSLLELANKFNLILEDFTLHISSRRITIAINNVKLSKISNIVEKRGPKEDAAPEVVAKFAASLNINIEQLNIVNTAKGAYYFANIIYEAKPIEYYLKELIENFLNNIKWPESMIFGSKDNGYVWVRPIDNILCLLDGGILDFNFHNLNVNNYTYGHRFLGGKITPNSIIDYFNKLRENFVIISRQERKNILLAESKRILKNLDEDLSINNDQDLIYEITSLVEYPIILLGNIDTKFMHLPPELLITILKNHQKYLTIHDKEGSLKPYFIFAANGGEEKIVIEGNEKVLKARLEDGLYFYNEDMSQKLTSFVGKMSLMIFHEKLGNMSKKIENIKNLSLVVGMWVQNASIRKLEIASELCKLDLGTMAVEEFPELQAIMGSYYAAKDGYDEEICAAIRNHYMPVSANDAVPKDVITICLSLADKIDSLVGFFVAKVKITSSDDQFGLRRISLGIIRLILENKLDIPLSIVINRALDNYSITDNNIINNISDFILERLKFFLKTSYNYDIVESCINITSNKPKIDILYKIYTRIQETSKITSSEKNMLLEAYKRMTNIISKEANIGNISLNIINEKLFESEIEHELYSRIKLLNEIWIKAEKEIKYENYLLSLVEFSILIKKFFTQVIINIENIELKENRINLIKLACKLFTTMIDFDKILII